jgi:retron-type reverse transcriptase
MKWESLVSAQNLKLAWRRINTGRNLHHKRFFRDFYLVYETALNDNLRSLRAELIAKAWQPTHPDRLYLPKPSGLQRPLSLLGIEDQIVLQAIANVAARKLARKREKLEFENVYSNILSKDSDSIFFLQSWQKTYNAFEKKCAELYDAGYDWVAHFDLAAYYDTISHELLLQIISPRSSHPSTFDTVKSWFKKWSTPNPDAMTAHGIPQGPIASDFLAEAFFLPVDVALVKAGVKYIRYVDDIRLFGRTEYEARRAAITLEWLCRDRGLIPQGKKFSIVQAKSAKDALGSLPSIPPENFAEEHTLIADEAKELLESSMNGRPLKIADKSRFRFVMYRAPKDSIILKKVLRVLPRHPEQIDAISAYLGRYKYSKPAIRAIKHALRSGLPYAYVRGELWHMLARLCKCNELPDMLSLAKEDARIRETTIGLSWGVMNFLIRCQEAGHCKIGRRLDAESPLSRALLASRIPSREFAPKRVIPMMLRGTVVEQLAAARQLQVRSFTLNSLGMRQRNLPELCQHSLRSLGVIRRASRAPRDWIAERLTKMYRASFAMVWRKLLGVEYEHCLQLLIEADAMFHVAPSQWLQYQNSFNDAVTRQFISYLRSRGNAGGSQKTIDKSGNLVKYGSLIQRHSPLDRAFPIICQDLNLINHRRNRLPGSHPYDEKGGNQNAYLKSKSRDALLIHVSVPLREIADWVDSNP